ncbi:MAG: glycosyltransferase family 4 protein [Thermomicrobiales bacterium]
MTSVTELVIQHLGEHGEVEVINLSRGDAARRRSWKAVRSLRQLQATFSILLSRQTGAIYIALNSGPAIALDCVLLGAARLRSRHVFAHHHSFSYLSRPLPLMRLLYAIGNEQLYDVVLCSSMRERLELHYGRSNAIVVTNPVETVAQGSVGERRSSSLVLGHLANLSREKGIVAVIETFELCRQRGDDVYLHLAGPFADQATERIVLDAVSRWPGRIAYRGPVYRDAKTTFYEGIDVFLYPTRYPVEAQPLVILESLGAGTVVMSVDRGCIQDLCTDSEAISLFDVDRFPEEASVALAELLSAPSRVQRLRQLAKDESRRLAEQSQSQLRFLVSAMRQAPRLK